jgi:LemA protein
LSIVAIAIVLGVIVVVGFVWLMYNRLVALRLNAANSWAQIEVALKRRHDLIPNLVGAVRGYATHERETLERVTEARGAAVSNQETGAGPARQGRSEGVLGASLGRMLVAAEAYPDLKADRNFLELGDELSDTEDQIAITRRVYNDTVQTYNTQIQVFPAVLVAKAFGFGAREFFEIPDGEVEAPAVAIPAGRPAGDRGGGGP